LILKGDKMIKRFKIKHFLIFLALGISLNTALNSEKSEVSPSLLQEQPLPAHEIHPVEILRAPAGSGPNDIGLITPDEANPEGPMSFALGKNEEIYILDQINLRIQVYKNNVRVETIPLPPETYDDLDLCPDGKIVLLDSLNQKALFIINRKGEVLNKIPLKGELIPDPMEVIEIQVVEEGEFAGIWVALDGRSVRLASLDGRSLQPIAAPGKFSLDGKRLMKAEILGEMTAAVYRSEENSFARWEPEITINFPWSIVLLHGLWDDQSDKIYLGAFLSGENDRGEEVFANEFVILSPHGKELNRFRIFVQKEPHEIRRSLRLAPEGNLYQMVVDQDYVLIFKYEL
jgi:hypothetical protein